MIPLRTARKWRASPDGLRVVGVNPAHVPAPQRSATATVESHDPRFAWQGVLAAFTVIGILRFTTFYLDDLTRALPGTFHMRFIEEASGAYGAMVLFPLAVLVERRFPLTAGRWRSNWHVHCATFVAYSVLHTTLMWGIRVAMFGALGHEPYDYGHMPTRYFMESPNDFFAYGAFLGFVTLLRVRGTLRDRELRVAALSRDAAESRLAALSVRLQPHFLFNALNTISSAIYESPAAADEMVAHLGDLLRHALRTSDRPEIALAEELEVLSAYLAIVGARFGDRVRCELQVDPRATTLAVPAFLLQPLVENAVRHGSVVEYPSAIVVRIGRVNDELLISVENEIPAGETEVPAIGTGLGTTRDRLRLLYGDAHSFSARAVGGRFEVKIRIPARAAPPPSHESHLVAHAGADR